MVRRPALLAVLIALSAVLPVTSQSLGLRAAGDIDYLTEASTADPLTVVESYLAERHEAVGLASADIAERRVSNRFVSSHNGVTHIYLQQTHAGIPVMNGVISAAVNAQGRLLSLASRFEPELAARLNSTSAGLDAAAAVERAGRHLDLELRRTPELLEADDSAERASVVSASGISQRPVPVGLVFVPGRDRDLRLAWNLRIHTLDGKHYWQVQVDAQTGDVLAVHPIALTWAAVGGPQVWPARASSDEVGSIPISPRWQTANGAAGSDTATTGGAGVAALNTTTEGGDTGYWAISGERDSSRFTIIGK